MTERDTWQPFGQISKDLVSRLEEQQRKVFERECQRDGVLARQKRNLEDVNESVA